VTVQKGVGSDVVSCRLVPIRTENGGGMVRLIVAGSDLLQAIAGHDAGLPEMATAVLEHAVTTFGSQTKAWDWLRSECGALQNRIPLDLLRQDEIELVEEELSRIDHGAYV
jgi:hypothetical protein